MKLQIRAVFVLLLMVHLAYAREVTLLDTRDSANLEWTVHKPAGSTTSAGFLEESYPHYEDGSLITWRSYTVCDIDSEQVDNWLRTPYVEVGDAERVYIEIKFSMRDCTLFPSTVRSCKETFTLLYYEAGFDFASDDMPTWSDKTYRQIDRIAADDGRFSSKEEVVINTETRSIDVTGRGLYFAFKDEGACMSILSVRVYYLTCPNVTIGHAFFHEESTGPEPASIKPVKGRCVGHAVTRGTDQPSYLCRSDGSWYLHSGACHCDAGYQARGQKCEPCEIDYYKVSAGNTACLPCPAHSYSSQSAARQCTCEQNYYRALDDAASQSCTQPPSPPTNVSVSLKDQHTLLISWRRSIHTGGRDDVTYGVLCDECDLKVRYDPARYHLRQTHVTLSNLQPSTVYRIQVYSENGVSDVSGIRPETEIVVSTDPAVPYNVRAVYIYTDEIKLAWDHATGADLYQVKYYATSQPANVSTPKTSQQNLTASALLPHTRYVFLVRARTSEGWGGYSEPLYEVTADPESLAAPAPLGNPNQSAFSLMDDGQLTAIVAGATAALLVTIIIAIILFLFFIRRGGRMCKEKGSASDCDTLEYRHGEDFSDSVQDTIRKLDPNYHHHRMLPLYTGAGMLLHPPRTYVDPHTYEDPNQAIREFAREIDVSCITIEAIIGGGEFGDVCKGKLRVPGKPDLTVAIKTLKPGSADKARLDFLTEASIMGQFNDPNVIYLQGVVTRSNPIMIITEFMEHGSLDTFLRLNDGQLSVQQLLLMLRGIASGMRYLSEMSFVHRDLAARNILVDQQLVCKVADFGLSREIAFDTIDGAYTTKGGKIPVRWTAPEAIAFRKFTSSSDVWSFGVVMWEVMSFGERPYWNWSNQDVIRAIEKSYRLPPPMDCPEAVHQLMLDCWQKERHYRPKFIQIVQTLDTLLHTPELLQKISNSRPHNPLDPTHPDLTKFTSIEDWLNSIKMGKYLEAFLAAGYCNMDLVVQLNTKELARIGITLLGHQKKIMSSVQTLRAQVGAFNILAPPMHTEQGFLV